MVFTSDVFSLTICAMSLSLVDINTGIDKL